MLIISLYSNIGLEYENSEKIIYDSTQSTLRRNTLWKCSDHGHKDWGTVVFDTLEEAKTACDQNLECRYIQNKDCYGTKGFEICAWLQEDREWQNENVVYMWGKSCALEKPSKDEFLNMILK